MFIVIWYKVGYYVVVGLGCSKVRGLCLNFIKNINIGFCKKKKIVSLIFVK